MVAFNTFSKLCVVVAFGLSATVTATDVAQEQPKKESVVSGSFRKGEESATKPHKLPERNKTYIDPEEPPMFSIEWYLLPKPENRAYLLEKLPFDVAKDVPEDCDEPIDPALEKRIRKFFSLRGLIFTSMSSYPLEVPEPAKYSVEWYLLPKPENRSRLIEKLPFDVAKDVPEDCNEPILPVLEKHIRDYFSWLGREWYLLPEPQSRAALRKALPSDVAETVPEDCDEPIDPEVEQYIKRFFSFSVQKQKSMLLPSF
ncbi:SmORF protein [Babesia bovis T2Bo]|uniref:SmORF n=1 Tax=Babesia bovis TaxID=5865 RepID=A7AML6_BABBO|nr:SmORF protein [Babesia bovis T2Bo]EDO07800.1 SmORF protein [Babesia bovis T2Bo]|eukprot:XP_001611368.1 SmORF [Babesia bovis]